MGIPGAMAVAHAGGTDAAGLAPPGTEPAYLLYYRGTLDAAALRKLEFEGEVGEPGVRGRLLNGGASLTVEGRPVDVAYPTSRSSSTGWPRRARDASRSTRWTVGSPGCPHTFSSRSWRPARRLPASCRGRSFRPHSARPRRAAGATRPRAGSRSPRRSPRGGDVAGCAGLLARTAIVAAQARLAEREEWALGEAGIVRRAGLGRSETILAATGNRPLELERAVFRMRVALGPSAGGTE
jgi:hypothetical protein